MALVLPLVQCGRVPRACVGGKAQTLGRMIDAGLPVPDGYCLTCDAFRLVREETSVGDIIADQLQVMARSPIRTDRALELIRNAIRDVEVPMKIVSLMDSAVGPLLARGPVVVRSSAPDEDSAEASHAGVYFSALRMSDMQEVMRAVRKCWASLFTERALFYNRERIPTDIAVVIQPYITAELAGVMFTTDIFGGTEDAVVELSRGGNEHITNGWRADVRIRLPKTGWPLPGEIPAPLAEVLVGVCSRVEELLGGPADIEWAWSGNTLVLLQARRIQARRNVVNLNAGAADIVCVPQEDVDEVFRLELGKCERLFMRQLLKNVWYRQYCRERGIRAYHVAYLMYARGGLWRQRANLLHMFQTPYVRIHWGDHSVLVRQGQLIDALIEGFHHNQVGDGSKACAQVGEVIPAEHSGLSSCTADGAILIEAFPAGVAGLKAGALIPSTYLADSRGVIIKEKTARFQRRGVLSTKVGDWVEVKVPEFTLSLTPEEIRGIVRATGVLSEQFGEVRLEWYTWQGNTYVKDLTIETQPFALEGGDGVLSPGSANGTVVRIQKIDEFDALAQRHNISVVGHGEDQDEAYAVGTAELMRARGEHVGSLIVVAQYPSIGLIPLIRYVKGFIFERGPLLCHTAIVLREHHIPAIVSEEAFNYLKDGDYVGISPAGVVVLRGKSCGRR
ncbi:MAG: PEP/pyruvate-binding domain-containing protein [Bacteroidota bacterium]